MPKGIILTALSVIVLGLIGYTGYHFITASQNRPLALTSLGTITHEPVSFDLEVDNPDDELLVYDSSLLVSGKTSPNASVIISDGDQDLALSASSTGDFSQVVTLSTGLNRILINAFDDQGNTKQVARTVYYSEEKIQ